MKKFVYIFGILIIAATLGACVVPSTYRRIRGSGNLVSEEREVEGFNRIALEGVGDLQITVGDTEKLTVEAEDNIIGRIESYVRGNTLYIGFERFIDVIPVKGITYTLTVKELEGLEISGYGDVYIDSLETNFFDVVVSGGGKIVVDDLTAQILDVQLSGAGDFELSGEVENQDVELSGAGSYKAGDLKSTICDVKISGAGSAEVWATEKLVVRLSGVGNLRYYGDPSDIDKNISGIGNVVSLGDHE